MGNFITGLSLVGFKPLSRFKIHHYVKPASFIYPDESVSILQMRLVVPFSVYNYTCQLYVQPLIKNWTTSLQNTLSINLSNKDNVSKGHSGCSLCVE